MYADRGHPSSSVLPATELRFRSYPCLSEIARGRRLLETMAQTCNDYDRDTIIIVASELLANAVQHGLTEIELRVEFHGGHIRVEAFDDGDGWPRLRQIEPLTETGGRGLSIVEHLSAAWGVEELIPGKKVWSVIPYTVEAAGLIVPNERVDLPLAV
jgi:anti-sigma regulatory factor (Ser/Thr protein kinase)